MSSDPKVRTSLTGESLAPVSELQEYGANIIAELDRAEAELDASENQPFSGIGADVMRDIASLRERQFDMFRRHVEIEQSYKIENAVAEGNDVQRMSFSGIAKTMRKKGTATAGLLDKLAEFDLQLRTVIDKIDKPLTVKREGGSQYAGSSSRRDEGGTEEVATESQPGMHRDDNEATNSDA